MTADGKVVDYETPRALETSEIPAMIDAYREGAENALKDTSCGPYTKSASAG